MNKYYSLKYSNFVELQNQRGWWCNSIRVASPAALVLHSIKRFNFVLNVQSTASTLPSF